MSSDDLVVWLRGVLEDEERAARDEINARQEHGMPATGERQVLRQVEAHRRILDTLVHEGGEKLFEDIFRLLASIYFDRPGYREEWAA